MTKVIAIVCMLLMTGAAGAQTDSTKKRDNTRVRPKPRSERKKIIGNDTAGYPHNRTPQWPQDSMRRNSNKVERLNHKKDTVNTIKQP